MLQSWTFGKKVGAGFVVAIALTLVTGGVGIYALKSVVASKDVVLAVNADNLIHAGRLATAAEWTVSASRGYLFAGEKEFTDNLALARRDFKAALARLKEQVDTEQGRRLVEQIERADVAHQEAIDRVVAQRGGETAPAALEHAFETGTLPKRREMKELLDTFVSQEERLLHARRQEASDVAAAAVRLLVVIEVLALLSGIGMTLLITRTLTRQLAAAVQHVQSSSAELQATANQQATGAKEQATAMSETSTTMSELLATSRQIAESARRVAHIAEETASAARAGDETVQKGQESVATIKRQVDLVVGHVLDLGKKSQQIGSVLDIINELAEQTNILAINATIESAGAGEAGKRFAVVADEIRKLADRVGGSTKEIRALIDEIRAAVSATVMATEGGSKAVEAGARQFGDVTASFKQIAGLVGTTSEAAREIELSTKQQSTSVEQVNVAITNVAQTTKEAETSSSVTLQTASQLTHLSRDLSRLIQTQGSA